MQNLTLEGFRLSPQQKQLWLLQPNNSPYPAQCAILLQGELQLKILKEAVQHVVNRHEILRTSFHTRPGIAIPMQVISPSSNYFWQTYNLTDLTDQEQQVKIDELFLTARKVLFDWEKDPLLRLSLLHLSSQEHILLIALPSLCADSWSLKNIVKEISHIYGRCLNNAQLPDEPVQYIQFSEWHNELLEEEAEVGENYWQQQLDLLTPAIPFDKQPTDTEFNPDIWSLKLDPAVVAQLESIAELHNTTIREFLLTCWQIFWARITGQSEMAIATVFDGRNYDQLQETLGLLAKCVPVSCSIQDNLKFSEILAKTSQILENHDQWQEYFLWSEKTASLNQIAFEFADWSDKYNAGGVTFSLARQDVYFARFKVKLTCIRQAESLTAEFHYDPEIIDAESISDWGKLWQTLVTSAVNNLEARVGELEILSNSDRHKLLFEFNQTQKDYPLDKCIHELFTEQVAKTPDKVAIVFEDQQLTYTQLNARANQLARYLQNLGVKPEVLVGIYLERSPLIIISLLAILKAGGAYLPLDPASPPAAIALRLEDAGAKVLLTQEELIDNLAEITTKIVSLDSDREIINHQSPENLYCDVKPENLVYTIYTSGSTGKPKGVAIEHRQLLNYFYAIQSQLNLTPGSSFALVSTLAADLGNTVIYPALCTGGCLHIIATDRLTDPSAIADYFDRHPIDCLKIVPSHLKALLTAKHPDKILPRQQLILGGEATSWELIDRIQQIAPECKILNHYGPTEATIGVTTFEVPKGVKNNQAATVPIGWAIANTQIYLLDSKKQPVPIGVPGELYIGGAGLARGYLNQPELTNEKFIANPFVGANGHSPLLYKTGDLARYLPDGTIEFLGRVDDQVKIRGFRIELAEISLVLAKHPAVRECVVLVQGDEPGNPHLVAYVIPHSEQNPATKDLKDFLQAQLPDYMVPAAFVLLKAFPLMPNGKLDRHSLLALETVGLNLKEYVAPQNAVEEVLASIWANLLKVERVGIWDNFFDLGGHSLLTTQLISRVRQTFRVEISLRDLFEEPTLAHLSKILIANEAKPGQTEKIAIAVKKIKTMSAEDKEKLLTHKKIEGVRS
ncbi:MAG: amino acid adenylation domain-containing protein [Pleurocapsa sp. SU_5_0]|nr:amino acid adenylation domain-containing protein [Pleurocapsa sp. SU_5_0]NJR45583.1 amino acid adenylation domain-containing protein [Hyellaceae cyanobacterium CSU_1_1]